MHSPRAEQLYRAIGLICLGLVLCAAGTGYAGQMILPVTHSSIRTPETRSLTLWQADAAMRGDRLFQALGRPLAKRTGQEIAYGKTVRRPSPFPYVLPVWILVDCGTEYDVLGHLGGSQSALEFACVHIPCFLCRTEFPLAGDYRSIEHLRYTPGASASSRTCRIPDRRRWFRETRKERRAVCRRTIESSHRC